MIQDCNAEIAPWKAPFLLLSIFCICAATYAIVPLLPIYFTEEIANGGLGWTKSDALSLYGTFLAVVYAAPFFGGVLGDFVLGKPISGLLGYGLIANGLFFLNTSSTRGALSLALLSLGLGFGFVKVNLTASVGNLPKKMLRKAYDYYYLATSLGFVAGGLSANGLFSSYAISGVIKTVFGIAIASMSFFLIIFGRKVLHRSLKEPSEDSPPATPLPQTNPRLFFALLALSIPFFVCVSQLTTSITIFLHQYVNRTVGGWTIPSLWFGALGSLIMTCLSPWLRKAARPASSRGSEILRISIGFGVVFFSLACTTMWAGIGLSWIPPIAGVALLLCSSTLSCIADFYVRPALFASATALIPFCYRTLSTGLVYLCIGLGGKLAGTLASFVDDLGFSMIFGTCSLAAFVCSCVSFRWWKRTSLPELARDLEVKTT